MSRPTPVQFRDTEIEQWLADIADPGESPGRTSARLLGWLQAIVDDEIKRARLLDNELNLIADALMGTHVEFTTLRYLWVEVEDSLEDGLAEKWDVDGPALVARLREMDLAALVAVVITARARPS